jgi:quercetin dioxygenase-like cupin family protein
LSERIFDTRDLVRSSDEKAKVIQVTATENTIIFVWGVRPGQEVEAHTHLGGQDTWIMIEGELTYYLGNGNHINAKVIIRSYLLRNVKYHRKYENILE